MHQCLLFCNKKELTEEAKKKLTGNGNVMCGKQELWTTQFPVLNSGMLTTEQHCLPSIIGRQKGEDSKTVGVTNVTGLLLVRKACFVRNSLNMFFALLPKDLFKGM